jgi:indolepyruvate ferredoxin oxidoreductase
VTLDDKYTLDHGRAFMSGVQALVKLPMLQRQRDALVGKNTAGFISGYRGSPLGGYDQALQKAQKHLAAQHIVFQPGVNEELAATALWGTQQLGFAPPGSKVRRRVRHLVRQGPGRGPLLRRVQARQHGRHHALGRRDRGGRRRPRGQKLHRPHQSDHIFKACGLPVFFPTSVQDILDLGCTPSP